MERINDRLRVGHRTYSSGSLDPHEDPVTGLQRVESAATLFRRRRLDYITDQQPAARLSREEGKAHILSEGYESLDYEIVENRLYKEQETHPKHQLWLWRQSVNRWVCAFLIGVVTALVACFIDFLVSMSSKLKFGFILHNLFQMCEKEQGNCLWRAQVVWILYNCVLVSIAASLVIFVAPSAAGSGIPVIKCFLNGIQIPEVVRLKTLVAKAIGVACSVGGGLAVGKEGPMIHSGAVVAAGISQGRCISLPIDFHVFEYFRNDREKRDFVSAGAAAGVAAAFGAPIGGVLFSLEEGASFWKQSLTWRIFFSAMISSFTLSSVLSVFNKKAGLLSWNGLANFGVFEENSSEYTILEIPLFLLMGVIGGLSGALFNHINYKLSVFRKQFVTNRWQKLLECLIVAAVSAIVAFLTIFIIDDCQPLGVSPNATEVTQLWCRNGEYSAPAHLFFKNPEESVKSLLHSPFKSFRPLTLAVFAVEYFLLSAWTYGLPVPSGIFIPALLTGAAWGRLFGIGVNWLFPTLSSTFDPGKYALAGAAAQLGGVVRMTISLTAIIVEATRDITFGLPIMLVLMMAKWVGDCFNEGLYDIHIALAEVPVLGWEPPRVSRNILAETVMRKDVIAFQPQERVGRIMDVLKTTTHHGYPVVDDIRLSNDPTGIPDYGRLQGLILRSQLITLLQRRVFSYDIEGRDMVAGSQPVELQHFRDAYPRYNVRLETMGVTAEDRQCWVHLAPFMHPSPHRVPLNASLPFIFRLFRGLGLRFLFVVDDDNRVKGVVTRKDVARFKEERRESSYRVKEVYISQFSRH